MVENPNAGKITFDVMQDVSGGKDPTEYIANPEGAGGQTFRVNVQVVPKRIDM